MRLNKSYQYIPRKTIKSLFVIVILLINNLATAQNGIKIGLNLSNYIEIETNNNWQTHTPIIGPYLGYFDDWEINRKSNHDSYFSFGYEVCVSAKGSILDDFVTFSEQTPFEIIDTSKVKKFFYYIELPHIMKFHYTLSQKVNIEMEFGGALSLLVLYGTKTFEHSNPNFARNETNFLFTPNLGEIPNSFLDYSLLGGLGIGYDDLLFNIRYTRGLIKVYPNTSLYTITLSVGYKLNE